ncbi:Zinc finger, ZZ type [Aphelenchoides bicaudatus]|nr:Zinc finger, ZZ type [Aphelenchoides bicaudatus]
MEMEVHPVIEQHSPTSSSSVVSDKENSTRDMLMTQRVKSIVSEFNKIASERESETTTRPAFSRQNPVNQSLNFHRQGFRNASMHVIPTGMRPPNGMFSNKATSDSLNSLLVDNFNAAKSGKLDCLTILQAACERKDKDMDEEVDKGDLFALQSQRIRLQNRYADLAKLRNDASSATGGKRSAIIDKKARKCLNDADQLLSTLRERIDQLGVLLEKHRHFEKLHDELDKWISDLQRTVQNGTPNQDLKAESIRAQMQNEHANFEELKKLAESLGIQQQNRYDEVAEKWNKVKQSLKPSTQIDCADANVKLNEALDHLTEFLGKTYDLNTSAQLRKQLERIDELEALCQENIKQSEQSEYAKIDESKKLNKKDGWTNPMTPKANKSIPIYDECTQSISTSPSSDRSIPISSFTSSHVQIHNEPMELHAFLESLRNYDCVKFAAYRTGIKLNFALFRQASIAQIPWDSLFTVLRCVYEKAHVAFPRSVPDVQKAIQNCVELLRRLTPNFNTKVVMLILIVLCKGKIDDKYAYLFLIYATGTDNTATASDLRLLFSDLAKLPALLQEDRAFGSANVESTVRSCLRASTCTQDQLNSTYTNRIQVLPTSNNQTATQIKSNDFYRWFSGDPQTLVWIRVMHRMINSEFAKHNARCCGCKMTPIVGIRFRCLHCFSVDLCQNCFFTQRAVKGHNAKHEMHEYYLPTTAIDNIRDVTQIIHNKMRRTRSSNKIGYMPVDLNTTVQQTENAQQSVDKPDSSKYDVEVNVDEKARRSGRLPPPRPPQRQSAPISRWPNSNNQKPAALTSSASPEDLSRLILDLQRENSALWQAFERRQQLNESVGNTSVVGQNSSPRLLQRFDSSTRELAEAMNCLLTLSNNSPAHV